MSFVRSAEVEYRIYEKWANGKKRWATFETKMTPVEFIRQRKSVYEGTGMKLLSVIVPNKNHFYTYEK